MVIGFQVSDFDGLAKSLFTGHCEDRSDEAISWFQAVTASEIASVRSQWQHWRLFTRPSILFHRKS